MTRAEVARLRRSPVGCCSRFADRMPCDCMERAEPSPAPCLTPDDLDAIEAKIHELYDLYNACARKRLDWTTQPREVDDLHRHLNRHFPGFYALQLLAEVRYLQARVVELTARLPPVEE